MTAAILLVIIALGLICGFDVKGLIKPLIGLMILLSILPTVECHVHRSARGGPASPDSLGWVVLAVVLSLVGFILWRGRAEREKRREASERRHGHPRRRALPPAPIDQVDDESAANHERWS